MRAKGLALVLIAAGIAGCDRPAPSEPDVLAGPIPECKALHAPERQAYMAAAKSQCDAATTFEEKTRTKGCEILQRKGSCENFLQR